PECPADVAGFGRSDGQPGGAGQRGPRAAPGRSGRVGTDGHRAEAAGIHQRRDRRSDGVEYPQGPALSQGPPRFHSERGGPTMRSLLASVDRARRFARDRVDQAVHALEDGWRHGEPALERYWDESDPEATLSVLAALVKADLRCR